jgi:hypothetical protein
MKVAIGSTILAVVAAVAIAIAAWPASASDRAYDNGEQVGQAVRDLYEADSTADVDWALDELDAAVAATRADVSGDVAQQVEDQRDALDRALDGFVGSRDSDDEWDAALYEAQLEGALDDLTGNASDFRAQGPEVHQAFWEGFQSGVNA